MARDILLDVSMGFESQRSFFNRLFKDDTKNSVVFVSETVLLFSFNDSKSFHTSYKNTRLVYKYEI